MTDLPVYYGYGGPSILSEDNYVYTAVVVQQDTEYNTKFTMLDLTTFEEIVLYRKDFPSTSRNGEYGIINPVPMVLLTTGILYVLEINPSDYPGLGEQWHLIKVDFNMEEITSIYDGVLISNMNYQHYGSYTNLSTFMTLVTDTETKTPYLIFDIVTEQETGSLPDTFKYYEIELVHEYEYISGYPGCMNNGWADGHNFVYGETSFGKVGSFVSNIVVYVFDIMAESLLNTYEIFNNDKDTSGGDHLRAVYSVPSPIYYNSNLYIAYSFNNDGRYVSDGVTKTGVESWYGLGPPGYEDVCAMIFPPVPPWGSVCSYHKWHTEQYLYDIRFTGSPFWLLVKTNPVTMDTVYKEFHNARNINVLEYNWDSPLDPMPCDPDPMVYPSQQELHYPDELVAYFEPVVYKMVFDLETECLYLKVRNPDGFSMTLDRSDMEALYPPPMFGFTPSAINLDDYLTLGLYRININDFNDYSCSVYPLDQNHQIYDLFMSKENAYIYAILPGANSSFIIKINTWTVVNADCGYHYITSFQEDMDWNENPYGMRLTQQLSTDEDRIWKLLPEASPDEFRLVGYSVVGDPNRELGNLPAVFNFSVLDFFCLHQHDGKFILVTVMGGGIYDPPILGMWLIQ